VKSGIQLALVVLSVLTGSCPSVLASSLDTPLAQYDNELLDVCLHGEVYEKAATMEIMGRILSPGLSTCIESLPASVLEEPLILSSIMRAIKTGGISEDNELKSRLIIRGLCSRDPLVNNDAIQALVSTSSTIPFEALWPPDKAPLVWGNPLHSRTVAPFFTGVDPESAAADPGWDKLSATLLTMLRRRRGHRFRLMDYPPEVQLEIYQRFPGLADRAILRMAASSGRRDLVLPYIKDIERKANLDTSAFRSLARLLPDSMLIDLLPDCKPELVPVLVGECSRRGVPLSPAQIEGGEELPNGKTIPPSSVDIGTLLQTTLDHGNWEYFEEHLHRRRLDETSAAEWVTLYSVAFLAESPPPVVRRRILADLAEEIQSASLPEQDRRIPADLLFPRLLSGLLSTHISRQTRWEQWLLERKPFEDTEKILFLLGGRDGYATSLRRFLGRGSAEGWLPADTPCPGAVVESLSEVQPPGDDIAGLALEPGLPPVMYPPAVWLCRSRFGKAVLKAYGDPSNPRLARDFLISRLGEEDLDVISLQHLSSDSRVIVSRFSSRLLRLIPRSGYEPFFEETSVREGNPNVAYQIHLLELLARLYQGLENCMLKRVNTRFVCGISRLWKPLKIGEPLNQLLPACHPEMKENFRNLAEMGPTRRLRHAAQWALWTDEGDESIPDGWIREAKGTNEARALEALDLLLAARYGPAAGIFSSLLGDSRDAFVEKGLEGALVFSFKVPTQKLIALARHHNDEVSRRAMLVLGKRQIGLHTLLKLVIDDKPYTRRYAAEALGYFHSSRDIDRIAEALKECMSDDNQCQYLFFAADRASYSLGDGSLGPTVFQNRMGPATTGRVALWLDWWKTHRNESLESRITEAYRTGLKGLESQNFAETWSAQHLLGLFVPITLGERRDDEIDAARRWHELGPSDDVFAWLVGNQRYSFPRHPELLRALNQRRLQNLVLRLILQRTKFPRGRDAQNPIVEQLAHELPNPFVGSCSQRAQKVAIWLRRELESSSFHKTGR